MGTVAPTFTSALTVELLESMASDGIPARRARVSTNGGDNTDGMKTEGLIGYLMRDRHGAPFEHAVMTFSIHAPIFVMRELMRHRIASYSEESGRYRELQPVFYMPDDGRKLVQTGKVGAYVFEAGTADQGSNTVAAIKYANTKAYIEYAYMLREGIAREVARMCLPVNIFSTVHMTINARSLMNLLSLRVIDPDSTYPSFPQWEIEQVARQMEEAFSEKMPLTHTAFVARGRVAP